MNIDNLFKIIKEDKQDLKKYLKSKTSIYGEDYIFFPPKNKTIKPCICLVSHIDTYHDKNSYLYYGYGEYDEFSNYKYFNKKSIVEFNNTNQIACKKVIFHDKEHNVIWSPEGIGGDDRTGVFACLELYKNYNCSILFTDLEEIGGIGAIEASKKLLPKYGHGISYFIEIDRKGNNQIVFYNKEKKEFKEYIKNFGFTEHIGSFSDISILCRTSKKPGVNVSAGFYNEHTKHEFVNLNHLANTITKVSNILKDAKIKF